VSLKLKRVLSSDNSADKSQKLGTKAEVVFEAKLFLNESYQAFFLDKTHNLRLSFDL